MQSDAGWLTLAGVDVLYANDLFLNRRFAECYKFADHAMALYSNVHWKKYNDPARAALRLAQAHANCGSRQELDSAISLLKQCLPHASDAGFIGWILSDLSQFYAAAGRKEEALTLGRKSVHLAAQLPHYDDYLHRHYDFIRILLQTEHVEEAREKVLAYDHHPYYLLVQAEVAQQAGMPESALRHIERIKTYIDTSFNISQPEIHYYRPLVETLAESLEQADNTKWRN